MSVSRLVERNKGDISSYLRCKKQANGQEMMVTHDGGLHLAACQSIMCGVNEDNEG